MHEPPLVRNSFVQIECLDYLGEVRLIQMGKIVLISIQKIRLFATVTEKAFFPRKKFDNLTPEP